MSKPRGDIVLKVGRYRHYSGKEYQVLGVAQHTERYQDWFVVFRAVDEPARSSGPPLWAKPIELFVERVDYEGVPVQKYTRIGD